MSETFTVTNAAGVYYTHTMTHEVCPKCGGTGVLPARDSVVHLKSDRGGTRAVGPRCGSDGYSDRLTLTTDPSSVTCRRCLAALKPARPTRRVHLLRDGDLGACGWRGELTTDRDRVTCKLCKNTVLFRGDE